MSITEQILDKLQTLVQTQFKGNYSAASKFLGIDPNSGLLKKWISRERTPSLSVIGPALDRMGIMLQVPDDDALDYDYVEKVAAIAGAGSSLVTSGETVGTYAFRKDFLLREGISARQSVMLDVVGDSMEPLIHAGDTILVDRSQIDVIDGKTYLVAYGEELRVKHVFKSPTGLILHSENSRYPDISIAYNDIGSLCVIHGRVRWFGRVI